MKRKKRRRPSPAPHPRELIQNELARLQQEGLDLPKYNPPPKRIEELSKNQKKVAIMLKKKEKQRTNTSSKSFIGWEYKDRYSHRKTAI